MPTEITTLKISLKKSEKQNIEYHVNMLFDDKESYEKNYPALNELIDNYRIIARGKPPVQIGILVSEMPRAYTVFFNDEAESKRFSDDLLKQDWRESINELRLAEVTYNQ